LITNIDLEDTKERSDLFNEVIKLNHVKVNKKLTIDSAKRNYKEIIFSD
jgi:hypothetical protein